MSVEKLLLIILFVAVSYYPLCGIIGLIRYIRGEDLRGEENDRGESDCHSCKTEYDCYECKKYAESEE